MSTRLLSLAVVLALAPAAAQACSGCGCTLDTDDAVSGGNQPGFRVDGRVDTIDQSHLVLGGKTAGASDANSDQVANGREVQQRTRSTLYTLGLDYTAEDPWGVNLAIPVIDRSHSTFGDSDNPTSPSSLNWTQLSDIRVLGRYTGLTASRDYGLLFGLKLPTGTTKTNFSSGTSAGSALDRGLQPGTGTTDLLLGLTQSGSLTDKLGWFATELWQKPLNEHDDFRPGQTLNANVGVRYAINDTFVPQLQLNGQNRWRDTGAASDRVNSGGEIVYVSPGLTVNLGEGTSLYGFVQLPVYQRVGGLELVPRYTASLGISHKF